MRTFLLVAFAPVKIVVTVVTATTIVVTVTAVVTVVATEAVIAVSVIVTIVATVTSAAAATIVIAVKAALRDVPVKRRTSPTPGERAFLRLLSPCVSFINHNSAAFQTGAV